MVGNTGTLMTMRIVRSKLRKRDESSVNPNTAITIETEQHHGHQSRSNSSNNHYSETYDQQIFPTTISDGNAHNNSNDNSMELETITFFRKSGICSPSNGWVFPPRAPSPNIYSYENNDAMETTGERNGFKIFKKQFSGRFKRLVSNKKDVTSPIPPELKPQLKSIYVY